MRKLLIILTIFIGCSAEKIQPESNKQRILFKVVYINSKTPTIVKDLPIYSFDAEIKDLIYCRDKDGNQVILNKKEIVALRSDGTPFIKQYNNFYPLFWFGTPMKTIKLGQRLKTDIPGEFVFAKIDHKSYGLAGITESFFGQDYFVDEYLDGFTKEQCKKMLDCCYEDSILIPQNITVEEYFNSVEFNDIPVGTKFKLDNRIYTKVKSASNGEELAMDVNFMVYGILSTETVIIEK